MKLSEKKRAFLLNNQAVLGLPMRLTISLVIGTIVLLAILSYLLNPCLFPQRMVVTVTPMITVLSDDDPENVSFLIHVNDTKGHPLMDASIVIRGLGGAGAGFSDKDGKALVQLQISLEDGLYEGYLGLSVKVPCYVSFEQEGMIKVVKRTS